jgi:hypothetical protein
VNDDCLLPAVYPAYKWLENTFNKGSKNINDRQGTAPARENQKSVKVNIFQSIKSSGLKNERHREDGSRNPLKQYTDSCRLCYCAMPGLQQVQQSRWVKFFTVAVHYTYMIITMVVSTAVVFFVYFTVYYCGLNLHATLVTLSL